MKLEPITRENADEACRLLEVGFQTPADHWRRAIDRAWSVANGPDWQVGHLLRREGRATGVFLAFSSPRRTRDGDTQIVVSQSNWYVEPESRPHSGLALARLLKEKDRSFVDFYPHEGILPLLKGLGFQSWSDGLLLVPLPQALLAGSPSRSALVALADLPANAVSEEERKLLADHERLGFIGAALDTGEGWRPMIFARRSVKRIPCAYLIYADSRTDALTHRGAIGRFMIRRGMPAFALEGHERDFPDNRMFIKRRERLFRGEFLRNRIDLAYSEFVFFDVKAQGNGIR